MANISCINDWQNLNYFLIEIRNVVTVHCILVSLPENKCNYMEFSGIFLHDVWVDFVVSNRIHSKFLLVITQLSLNLHINSMDFFVKKSSHKPVIHHWCTHSLAGMFFLLLCRTYVCKMKIASMVNTFYYRQ